MGGCLLSGGVYQEWGCLLGECLSEVLGGGERIKVRVSNYTDLRRAQSTNRYTAHSTCDRPRDLTREQTGPSWEAEEAAVSPTDMWHHLLETDGPIEIELQVKNPEIT